MTVRAGVDVGGTFTDLVAISDGRLHVVKVPTTVDQADGFLDALTRLESAGLRPDEVLHGTTVATNAVLERRGARVAFVTTDGFAHLLHLARQDRPSLYDPAAVRTPPVVDRDLCFGVKERIGPSGEVLLPLDDDELRVLRDELAGAADAVAVCLLHAYASDAHEQRVAALLREGFGDGAVSISSEVLPEFREYERASTTALNAYVQPVVSAYLNSLEAQAGEATLRVMRSGGGLRSVEECARLPVHLLYSGPAAGVLGAAWVADRCGFPDVVTLDLGGTSADVALVDGARPAIADHPDLDGLPFRTPCVDVISVGAGGGSIAFVDDGGALRVGPRSAGSVPGPACYGRGGREPTVTDAHVVLGHLDGEGLAGGELALDATAAREAVGVVAASVGLSIEGAADGILRIARATMTRAIRAVSIERGKDVRRYALVAFGGAGPLHATAVARELGITTVLIPPSPGALAAFGLLVARRRADASRSVLAAADGRHDADLGEHLRQLRELVLAELRREGVDSSACEVVLEADCRYAGQSHEIRVAAPTPFESAMVAASFHAAHRERFGYDRRGDAIEAVTLRATALGPEPDLDLRAPDGPAVVSGERRVGGTSIPVWDRGTLPAEFEIAGPAIVSELDSTTLVDEGASAVVHRTGTLVVTLLPSTGG